MAQHMLWKRLVIDFGHELVTAIHTPLVWSNQRPSTEEFQMAYANTSLSATKIIEFIKARKEIITSLNLCNSDGFWADDGEYLSLNNKHNFFPSHLGYILGQLGPRLTELRLHNCNDLINSDQGLWSLVALCPNLQLLAVEGLNCRVLATSLADISKLPKLNSLALTCDEGSGQWIVGLDTMPQAWSQLSALTSLELRGHHLLDALPTWLKDMPQLRKLDVSCNANVNLANVTLLTQLEVLALQKLDLTQQPVGDETLSQHAKRILPNLEPLAKNLKALSLARNRFTRLPDFLPKMANMEVLDFSGNKELQVLAPLTPMISAMPRICVMDFREVHKEKGASYWSDAKCTTMKFVAAGAKVLKRRKYAYRVLIDRD
eukprot:CAMPEP_0202896172 /NCGR_PEP_ID=MMETSP1392-20130828/5216_1 /ASSEMBLY_ACC=CAM_ASM_000868 /TAXON_ID=225041 /ORGANISM="Chlamydomonas chlamydogama, Strain SAG 11-48b" /LENGTH=374 /DNA_ID=CAMNT_0049581421 /DNA_START=388 /DNA_END=1512 /DNA_ORIENTATION=-